MWIPRHPHNKTKKVPGEKAKHQTRLCTKIFAYLHLPQGRTELFLSSGLEGLCNGDRISPEEHLPKLSCLGLQDRFTELGQAPHDHDGITRHDWRLSVLKDKKGEGAGRQDVKNKFATGFVSPKSWQHIPGKPLPALASSHRGPLSAAQTAPRAAWVAAGYLILAGKENWPCSQELA